MSFVRISACLILSFLLLSQITQGKHSNRLVKVFKVSGNNKSSHLLTPPKAADPLASVAPLFGHSKSQLTFAMPGNDDANNQRVQPEGKSGLPYTYEVNRPTRVLPAQEGLTSCTVTLATHSFGNRCV